MEPQSRRKRSDAPPGIPPVLEELAEMDLQTLRPDMEQLKMNLKSAADQKDKLRFNKEVRFKFSFFRLFLFQFVVKIGETVENAVQNASRHPEVTDIAQYADILWRVAAKNYTKKTHEDLQRFYTVLTTTKQI